MTSAQLCASPLSSGLSAPAHQSWIAESIDLLIADTGHLVGAPGTPAPCLKDAPAYVSTGVQRALIRAEAGSLRRSTLICAPRDLPAAKCSAWPVVPGRLLIDHDHPDRL